MKIKFFGPFTWRQFVYLAGGAGMGIVSFITLPFFFFVLIGFPLAGLAFLLAFYPVNNRPFSIFLESIFRFYQNSRVYHWKKQSNVVYRGTPNQFIPQVPAPGKTHPASESINTLSRKLELNALQKKT